MNTGMFSSLSGGEAAMRRMDVITNNLANMTTSGFKRDRITFDSVLAGQNNPSAVPSGKTADAVLLQDRIQIDYSEGEIAHTGNVLDMAIAGDGFFIVQTPDGIAYTRQGKFQLSSDGTLVTLSGFPVLSSSGSRPEDGQPMKLDPAQIDRGKLVIDDTGNITMGDVQVGKLGLFDFQKPYQLGRVSGSLFSADTRSGTPQVASDKTKVKQGFIEQSNVSPIAEMIFLVDASRYFENTQKVIRNFDEMATKAINELGKV